MLRLFFSVITVVIHVFVFSISTKMMRENVKEITPRDRLRLATKDLSEIEQL